MSAFNSFCIRNHLGDDLDDISRLHARLCLKEIAQQRVVFCNRDHVEFDVFRRSELTNKDFHPLFPLSPKTGIQVSRRRGVPTEKIGKKSFTTPRWLLRLFEFQERRNRKPSAVSTLKPNIQETKNPALQSKDEKCKRVEHKSMGQSRKSLLINKLHETTSDSTLRLSARQPTEKNGDNPRNSIRFGKDFSIGEDIGEDGMARNDFSSNTHTIQSVSSSRILDLLRRGLSRQSRERDGAFETFTSHPDVSITSNENQLKMDATSTARQNGTVLGLESPTPSSEAKETDVTEWADNEESATPRTSTEVNLKSSEPGNSFSRSYVQNLVESFDHYIKHEQDEVFSRSSRPRSN